MFLEASLVESMIWVGAVGAVVGLVMGFLVGAGNLVGTMLMGVIGSIAASAIFRIAGAPPIYGVGDDFSLVWGALGGAVLAFVVGSSSR